MLSPTLFVMRHRIAIPMFQEREIAHIQVRHRIVWNQLQQLFKMKFGALLTPQFHFRDRQILEGGPKCRINLQHFLKLDAGLRLPSRTQQCDAQQIPAL